jgi:hypothetical protein
MDPSTQSNVHDIIQEAIETARFICEDHYDMFRSPPIQLICPPHLNFAYVPGHLSHIIFELLKVSTWVLSSYWWGCEADIRHTFSELSSCCRGALWQGRSGWQGYIPTYEGYCRRG